MSTFADFTIAIAATFTAEPLEESLRFWSPMLYRSSQVRFATYNQVFQQLLDPSSLLSQNQQGVNLVIIGLEDWSHHQVGIEQSLRELRLALQAMAERSTTPHLVCFCPAAPAWDDGQTGPQEQVIDGQQLEAQIVSELGHFNHVHLILPSDLAASYPVADYYDPQGKAIGHIPFTSTFFAALGTGIMRKIHTLQRQPYKVIVLDCDQTLWQGVCGEEGPDGIEIDPPRRWLQEFMIAQSQAGMLLCLCSKNSEADVMEVFRYRQDMPLKREHLVSWRINWQPKSENIRALAQELQLGLESFILIDDNPIECAEVQTHCPEVLTLQLPPADQIPTFLQHVWAFDHVTVTQVDRQRTIQYQENIQRQRLKQESLSLEDFLKNLQLNVQILPLMPHHISRAAQLTLRTNQFNLTTRRRSESEIQQLCQSGMKGLVVEVSDRFGDYGLVGLILYQPGAGAIEVDTFLLSCRALGRGIEHRMLAHLGQLAQASQYEWVNLLYRSTQKNQPALSFLNAIGAGAQRVQQDKPTPESKPELDEVHFSFRAHDLALLTYHPADISAAAPVEPAEARPVTAPETAPEIDYTLIATQLCSAEKILQAIVAQRELRPRPELRTAYVAPRNPLEQLLTLLWQNVLGIEAIGIHDNFFKCGGDSLKAAVLITQIGERINEFIYAVALFDAPTVADFAAYLNKHYSEAISGLLGANISDDPNEPEDSRVNEAKVAQMRQLIPALPPLGHDLRTAPKNPPIIFVLSPPRSGSTLLRVMLAGHPGLFAPPELHLLGFNRLDERRDVTDRFWSEGIVEAISKLKGCSVEEAEGILEDCENQKMSVREFYQLLQTWTGNRILVDKTPIYSLDTAILERAELYFEQSVYIHLLRHPYGMIKSFEQAKLDLAHRYDYPFTRRELAELIWLISHQNILEFLQSVPQERQYQVKYEDIVTSPQETLMEMCQFLNLEFHPDMLEIHSEGKDRMTRGLHSTSRMLGDMKFHGHKGISAKSAHSWKDYYQTDFLGEVTRQLATELGYPQTVIRTTTASAHQRFSPIVPIQKGGSKRPFFCVHPVSGSVLCYTSLAFSLGLDQPFYALQTPGLTGEREPLNCIQEMAAHYNQSLREIQPQGPYLLGGWSMGGVVALEMAHQLVQQGEQVDLLTLIDSRPPGFHKGLSDEMLMIRFARDLWRLSGKEMVVLPESLQFLPIHQQLQQIWEKAKRVKVIPADMDLEQLRCRWQVYRAHMQALQSYEPKTYSGRVALFYSQERGKEDDLAEAWTKLSIEGIETYMLPCDHYTIIKEPHVHELSRRLKSYINAPSVA